MADQVLYRKYRSSNFAEVIGQEHVVRTLSSALSSGRLSHAYLFTGPRGVGKTSVARLLARALNCSAETKPCNECATCLTAINSSMDVIEIDAASNRSIDAVRDLREKVGLAPTQGQYKVYIIDEVHMLTTEAFNALLKTLEEPPAHAVFILATTEAHKLPETIISRTQRFNFKPITTSDIAAHLTKLAAAEKITIEPDAIEIISNSARGGFRDAIGLLDQLASSGITPITAATVRDLLGYSSAEEISALSKALASGDTKAALEVLTRIEATGVQPGQIALQLTEQWRAILLCSAGAAATASAEIKAIAATISPARAVVIVETLLETTRSHWPQLALETAVVKLTVTATEAPAPVAKRTAATTSVGKPAARAQASAPSPEPAEATSQAGNLRDDLWPKVLVILKSQNNSLCALLQMYPVDFGESEVTIKPRFNFHRDLFLKPANRSMIEAAASKVYGRTVKVSSKTDESLARVRKPKPDGSAELVSSALEILGGEMVE